MKKIYSELEISNIKYLAVYGYEIIAPLPAGNHYAVFKFACFCGGHSNIPRNLCVCESERLFADY